MNYELTRDTKFVRAALGFHPQLVADYPNDVDQWARYVDQTPFIGEVGVDAGPRYYKSIDVQRDVFEHILKRCALSGPKILSIHSVSAVKVVLDYLERFLPMAEHSVVLHWFTGSASELRRASELGCHFSVNAQMISGERGKALLKQMPLERLLTETDGPFTECLGRPSSPADIHQTVHELAASLGLNSEHLGNLIHQNLTNLLGGITPNV